VLIVPAAEADAVVARLKEEGESAWIAGEVARGERKVALL